MFEHQQSNRVIRILFCIIVITTITISPSFGEVVELSEVEFADMNAWNKRGPADSSNWVVQTGGRTVKQTVNVPSFA